MPRLKTNSGAKERFGLTRASKIKHNHTYCSHILTKKTKKQKRNLVGYTLVGSADIKQVRGLFDLR